MRLSTLLDAWQPYRHLRPSRRTSVRPNSPWKDLTMFAANSYVIHHHVGADRLAELDSQRPLTGPALVGEIDGKPAAAISLDDGRVVADPFQQTARLVSLLRMRARALHAADREPSVSERLRAAVRVARALPAA